MKSKNNGEHEGKPNYVLLFEDFPITFERDSLVTAVRKGDYKEALGLCLVQVAMSDVLEAREYGANKYDRHNWKLSRGTEDHNKFLDANKRSIYRHLAAHMAYEDRDAESGCKHLAHVALRLMIAIEYGGPVGDGVTSEENLTALGASIAPPSLLDLDPLADFRKKVTKSLYDWSKIDSEYKWCATGPQGTARAFEYKPFIEGEHWEAMQGWASDIFSTTPDLAESWQDSLEERPKS